MTPDFPNHDARAQLEARLTAFILGELPAHEAAALRQTMDEDPELAALYERLKGAIKLVREAAASPAPEASPQPAPLRLSEDRRQKLLAQFKTVTPKRFVREQKKRSIGISLLKIAAVLGIIGFLATLTIPNFIRSRRTEQLSASTKSDISYSLLSPSPADHISPTAVSSPTARPFQPTIVLPAKTEFADAISPADAKKPELNFKTRDSRTSQAMSGRSGGAASPDATANREQVFAYAKPSDISGALDKLGRAEKDQTTLSDNFQVATNAILAPFGTEFGIANVPDTSRFASNPAHAFSDDVGGLAIFPSLADPNKNGQAAAQPNIPDHYYTDLNRNSATSLFSSLDLDPDAPLPPPDVSIKAKFADITQADGRDGDHNRHAGTEDSTASSPKPSGGRQSGLNFVTASEGTPAATGNIQNFSGAGKATTSGATSRSSILMENATSTGASDSGKLESIDRRIAEREDKTDTRRKQPNIVDTNPLPPIGGKSPGPMNVTHYNSLKIDNEIEYVKEEALLNKLDGLSLEDLKKTIPTVAPDNILNQLLHDQAVTEALLAKQKADPGADESTVKRTEKELEKYRQESDSRAKGIVKGIESSVRSLKLRAGKLEEANISISNEVAMAEFAQLKKSQEQLVQNRKIVDDNPVHQPQVDAAPAKTAAPAPIPQPEVLAKDNAFSTFSLNVADVSFKLAAASLEKGQMPDPATIRSEEFINAFDYRDPEPAPGAPLAFAWERARYPFAHNRDLLRFSVKTAAAGRPAGRPLNIVLLLDNSGSMERSDRVRIIHEALRVLGTQLKPEDKLSVVTFARTARLWVDGLAGSHAGEVAEGLSKLSPEGGTNLEEAMKLAYETARRHYLAGGVNRVVLLTDGAANLGNLDPDSLKQKVEEHRKEGIALDCFGIGWEGYNDDLLEVLSRNGDGRYGFINTPAEAASGFAQQLAGALNVAASDVKVQVEFNPKRVTTYRQIGYAKHQLTKEQFRDNTVDAAEIGAAESGNALYTVEANPDGEGPLATVRVRYKIPGTGDYREQEWVVPFSGNAGALEQSSAAMRLAGTASAFSEWLATSPFAGEVTMDQLLGLARGVPEIYGADERPKKLEWMIRQAKSLEGK